MRLLILAAAALVTAPASADPIHPGQCRDENARVSAPRVVKPQRLGDMPPATQFKAVHNSVDGCPQPIVVRRNVGEMPPRR